MVNALYPYRCPICEKIVGSDGECCTSCQHKVKYIVQPFCMKCGKQLYFDEEELCHDCDKTKHLFARGIGAFSYTEELKQSIYRFKYGNKREYAKFYGKSLVKLRGDIVRSWEPDVIIPVPLHRSRQRKRGFNQTELIARVIGRELQIPVDEKCLYRIKNTVPQKELNDKERGKNVKKAFQVRDNVVKYKKIVLVDDIYTTGTTVDACAETLLKAGAKEVYCISVCIGRGF